MENPIKMDDLGGKPTIFGNIHFVLGICTLNFLNSCAFAQGAAGGLTVAMANARLALKKVAEFQVSSCDEEIPG